MERNIHWRGNILADRCICVFHCHHRSVTYIFKKGEVTQASQFSAFILLAIVVACLGLYGLAAFTAERGTKEIGIRKIMGAPVRALSSYPSWMNKVTI